MLDLGALAVTVTLLAAYQLFLHWRTAHEPLYTVHALNVVAREEWVQMVMSRPQHDVLAVQTLRNSVMAASFMASTAIILMIGTLSLLGAADAGSGAWHALNVGGAIGEEVTAWKVLFLIVDFFVAFFCFSMAVRFYSHVGYMISLPVERARDAISPPVVTAYLNRAGLFYLLGTRSFFYSVPLVFWMFGPHFMVFATLALIATLYLLDRAPRPAIQRHRAMRTLGETPATRLVETAAEAAAHEKRTG